MIEHKHSGLIADKHRKEDPSEGFNKEDGQIAITNLKKHFTSGGYFNKEIIKAVDGVSLTIPKGQTFGIIGESGCGKSTLGRTMLRIEEPTSGSIEMNGTDVRALSVKELRKFRKNAQIVYQDPGSSLNPRKRVGDIITKPLAIHKIGTKKDRNSRVDKLLERVRLSTDYKHKYPSELSGGEKQRVGIARALAVDPEFIVLDEPTSALDASVQARVLLLLAEIQKKDNITYLYITHNLSLVKNFADWIGIMYLGKLVEVGKVSAIFNNPQHPYTRALLSSIPVITEQDVRLKPERIDLEGEIPDPSNAPSGCSFRTRCPKSHEECAKQEPEFYKIAEQHYSRCLLNESFSFENDF